MYRHLLRKECDMFTLGLSLMCAPQNLQAKFAHDEMIHDQMLTLCIEREFYALHLVLEVCCTMREVGSTMRECCTFDLTLHK